MPNQQITDGHSRQQTQDPAPREPATEAARTALLGTRCNAATSARIVNVASRKRDGAEGQSPTTAATATAVPSTAAAWGPTDGCGSPHKEKDPLVDDGGDTDGPLPTNKEGGGKDVGKGRDGRGGRAALEEGPAKDDGKGGGMAEVLIMLLVAYWDIVAPVFEAGSPISKRFSVGRSTWHDCLVYVLALAFVLVVFLAVVWVVRGVLLVAGLGKMVLRGCLVVVGF